MDVINALLHSRRFWLAVLAVLNIVLDAGFKFPPGVRDGINNVLLILIGMFTIEDAARFFGRGNSSK